MLNAICTALMYGMRHLLETNLKLIRCTIGQTFQDPWHAVKRSFLILVPIADSESPLTRPRYVKKTLMKMGHQKS